MATSIDNYNDLEELGINCDEDDSLTCIFNKAANHLQNLISNIDNQTLVELYGLYKQATQGVCNVPKPSWYDIKAKSKWEAWSKLNDMPKDQAKHLYIERIKKIDPKFNDDDLLINPETKKEQWVSVSVLQNHENSNTIEKTPVYYIQENDCIEFEKLLINNPDINKLDNDGLALIHWASDRGSKEILEILLKHGADVNLKDSDGQTALHYASSCGHIDCIKFLLNYGADKDLFDNEQQTPRDVASDDNVKELFD